MASDMLVNIVSGNGLLPRRQATPQPMLTYCQLDHEENIPIELHSKFMCLIQENTFENVVCKMSAICSDPLQALIYSVFMNMIP